MSRGIKKWSEEAITRLQREGRGTGHGPNYKPWILTTDMYSLGRTHELYSHKTRRQHQLLSDGERDAFLLLEWSQDIIDIREQLPLPRDITRGLALENALRHPHYPGTHVPVVMTIDFVVTKLVNGQETSEAFSVKVQEDLNKPAVVERLELERVACQGLGMPYRLLVKERMPQAKLKNIRWIRDAQLDRDAIEPFPGFYEQHQVRMWQDITNRRYQGSLADYCAEYDRRYSVELGTALRVARMLLSSRTLVMDLNNAQPQCAPMASFTLTALQGRLRAVGGI
jgi:hypothetical protein